ncbi:MAG TPA: hypothetical protein VK395_17180 [Gemmataceae bacterium]|nr:hypothetical protein [Gemmataceae bacterium]
MPTLVTVLSLPVGSYVDDEALLAESACKGDSPSGGRAERRPLRDGFANGSTAFFNSTSAVVQTVALQSLQVVTSPSPLGG